MKERLRAPLAALIALLIGGDLAARGPAALADVGRFVIPYLWLFLAVEAVRRRRSLSDVGAFFIGSAAGLLYDGAYLKALQDGVSPLGIDWLAAVAACFDWGLISVLALHAADALSPRPETDLPSHEALGRPAWAVLILASAALLLGYLSDVSTGRVLLLRELGPAWLLADLLFVGAAAFLIRGALFPSDATSRRRLRALGLFCAWLPGMQLLARAASSHPALGWMLVAAWSAALIAWARTLRFSSDDKPRRAAKPLLAAAAWRLAGALILLALFGPAQADPRAASAFSFLVDLPTRLLFLSAFLTTAVRV